MGNPVIQYHHTDDDGGGLADDYVGWEMSAQDKLIYAHLSGVITRPTNHPLAPQLCRGADVGRWVG